MRIFLDIFLYNVFCRFFYEVLFVIEYIVLKSLGLIIHIRLITTLTLLSFVVYFLRGTVWRFEQDIIV